MRKIIGILMIVTLFSMAIAYAVPEGATVTQGVTETKTIAAAGNHSAFGGNITELNLSADSQTLVWQGYWGEVTGMITLDDASGDTMYDWTLATIAGEVYASRSNAVAWATIAAENDCTTDEGITGTGADRVNNTFTASSNSAFNVGSTLIAANTACATNTYINSTAQAVNFEEIMLTDGANTVYATILENNLAGFDNNPHDFQLIVPEDNDGTTTTYYFYVELS